MKPTSRLIIPPLPLSKSKATVMSDQTKNEAIDASADDEKENIGQTSNVNSNKLKDTSTRRREIKQRIESIRKGSKGHRRGYVIPSISKTDKKVLPGSSSDTNFTSGSSTAVSIRSTNSRILRFGETFNDLFCLSEEHCDDEYRKLCLEIVNDGEDGKRTGASNDLGKWRKVLEAASRKVATLPKSSLLIQGKNLIRLHKRATSRFSSVYIKNKSESSQKDLLAIWLLYAEAQSRYGSRKDAKSIFQHIQNKRLGERDSIFYIALAQFETDQFSYGSNQIEGNPVEDIADRSDNRDETYYIGKAEGVIKMGIERGAEPAEDLTQFLARLESRSGTKIDEEEASFSCEKEGKCPTNSTITGSHQIGMTGDNSHSSKNTKIEPIVDVRANLKTPAITSIENTGLGSSSTHGSSPKGSEKNSDNDDSSGNVVVRDDTIDLTFNFKMPSITSATNAILQSTNLPQDDDAMIPTEKSIEKKTSLEKSSLLENNANKEAPDYEGSLGASTFMPTSKSTLKISTSNTSKSDRTEKVGGHIDDKQNGDMKLNSPPELGTKNEDPENEFIKDLSLATPAASSAPPTSRKHVSTLSKHRKLVLPRKRLGGGALRISAETAAVSQLSDIEATENNDASGESNDKKKARTDRGSNPLIINQAVAKITQLDIGYIKNWDPSGRKSNSSSSADEMQNGPIQSSSIRPARFGFEPVMEKIEEVSMTRENSISMNNQHQSESPVASKERNDSSNNSCNSNQSANSGKSSAASKGKNDSSYHSFHSNQSAINGSLDIENNRQAAKTPLHTVVNEGETTHQSQMSSPEEISLAINADPDFLPLIHKNNILRVNDTPFVKLGVIGKGGSCKVYKAMSKDQRIVAIKKVKLAGMAKKAVEGYANEISLLRRLRGNPAIIQMYDSEVDLKRKAIFLVMELGEVDLNHVLQQQALKKTNGVNGDMSLNMNFIRLTWQQMLSAVHCIHEERIIHGDLKPANFLFVKGTLKLIDFGIAKAIQSDDTTNIYRDSQIGTLNYMSPESILDSGTGTNGARMKCGRPSDVWSLGCILYQMCYGKTPFAELHMIKKLQAIVNPNYDIKFPETINDAAIDAMKLCLEREPQSRLPIVGENGLLNAHWFLHPKRKG